jgi:hypothetical protein
MRHKGKKIMTDKNRFVRFFCWGGERERGRQKGKERKRERERDCDRLF